MSQTQTKTYCCENQVNHDGVLHAVGEPIELTPEQAGSSEEPGSLLGRGHISDPSAKKDSGKDKTSSNVVNIGDKNKTSTSDPGGDGGDGGDGGEPDKVTPTDPAARAEFIKMTIIGLDKNDEANFTNSNKPDANVLTEKLGWKVTAKERDAVWESLNDNAE